MFEARGHLIADVDPLGIQNPESAKLQGTPNLPPAVVVRQHLSGMTEADMNREFSLGSITVIGGEKKKLPLRDILIRLNQVYCGHLGLEYTYIHDMQVVSTLTKLQHLQTRRYTIAKIFLKFSQIFPEVIEIFTGFTCSILPSQIYFSIFPEFFVKFRNGKFLNR